MRRTATLVCLIVVALLAAAPAGARLAREATLWEARLARPDTTFWHDDMESGATGWTHGDFTATAVPHFHVDTYLAYSGHSWWCGTFDYDADGGYGNSWDDRLDVPATDWTGYTYPLLMFQYRNDSELGYDFTFVQAESAGTWVNLNRGYNGRIGWGPVAYYLGNKDNPAVCRFRFQSDGAWSDEDGLYDSVGGGFACDDIEIMDYITSDVLFFDDVETGGLCVPSIPAAAGDYWHLDNWLCRAYSGNHYWEICWPSTTFVQPSLQNWLQTPVVDVPSWMNVTACTLWYVGQIFWPGAQEGVWTEEVSVDGGTSWWQVGAWYGDQCGWGYGPCDHFLFSMSFTPFLPGHHLAARWTVLTDELGNTADPACPYLSAGMAIDDTWITFTWDTPVEETSWGKIKSLYR